MSIEYSQGRNKDIAQPTFEMKPVRDNSASEREGRPIFTDKEFVTIRIPGDRLLTWDGEVNDSIRARFREKYEAFKRGQQRAVTGTPLEESPMFTKSRVAELKANGIMSLEEYADVPDGTVVKLGMGARSEREKVRVLLMQAKEGAAAGALAAENADLKRRLEALEAALLQRSGLPDGEATVTADTDTSGNIDRSPKFFWDTDRPIEEFSDEELKTLIKRATGEGVRGVPSRETLIRRAIDIAKEKTEVA